MSNYYIEPVSVKGKKTSNYDIVEKRKTPTSTVSRSDFNRIITYKTRKRGHQFKII